MKRWQIVKLGEVVSLDLNMETIDHSKEYPMVGVYSFGRGLFDREPVQGSATSYKKFYRLKAEHIVMSQLFGWEGALALSSDYFQGKYVSPQFPTFLADNQKLDRVFLGWLMKRHSFWNNLGKKTRGMGDRRRTLNPDAFLSMKIALPSIADQRHKLPFPLAFPVIKFLIVSWINVHVNVIVVIHSSLSINYTRNFIDRNPRVQVIDLLHFFRLLSKFNLTCL